MENQINKIIEEIQNSLDTLKKELSKCSITPTITDINIPLPTYNDADRIPLSHKKQYLYIIDAIEYETCADNIVTDIKYNSCEKLTVEDMYFDFNNEIDGSISFRITFNTLDKINIYSLDKKIFIYNNINRDIYYLYSPLDVVVDHGNIGYYLTGTLSHYPEVVHPEVIKKLY